MKKISDEGSSLTYWSLLLDPRYLFALGFGSGLARWAPGTCGTIAALPIYWWFLATSQTYEYFFVVTISFLVGVYICGELSKKLGVPDHSCIVWDEFVGIWITLYGLPPSIYWVMAGFVTFRLLDILKPWPIRFFDSRIKGGTGIMLDDVVAGLIGCSLLNIINNVFF